MVVSRSVGCPARPGITLLATADDVIQAPLLRIAPDSVSRDRYQKVVAILHSSIRDEK
jgi:hypothetical protein